MAYNLQFPLTRLGWLGAVGDATSRSDSVKSVWGYATADVAATVETAGYFNLSAGGVTIGDRISAVMNCAVGQTPVTKDYVVTALSPNVTIAIQQATAG